MVFVPVRDIGRAIIWYSELLGLPIGTTTHEGKIYNVPMQGDVGLILDAHQEVTNSSQPLFFFWTTDIEAAASFLRARKVETVGGIQDIGSVRILTFVDPDGNRLMVTQKAHTASLAPTA